MEITGENYRVTYDPAAVTVTCQGTFRLRGTGEYAPLAKLLNEVADQKPDTITLNLRGLQFLNSSGINMFSRFVIRVRNQNASKLVIKGTEAFPWQGKSLRNLQRLMPDLQLEFE